MNQAIDPFPGIAVVAIGRNEGQRLRACLESVMGRVQRVIYVDSGSTDDSVAMARQMGAMVVELDRSVPFTAARARNAGFECLMASDPGIELVQFVDGDCEVRPGWIETAAKALRHDAKVAAVCGRRRERFPEASVYNRLCDIEWDTPVGQAMEFGGDVMMRAGVLRQLGGYNPGVIAAEDTELGVRLRQAGWTIQRLDAEMTLHDAAMTRLGQWWKRNVRAGHGFAEGAAMHGRGPTRHWVRQSRSIWVWGLLVPAVAVGAAWGTWGGSLLLLGGYPVLYGRIRRHARGRGLGARDASAVAKYTLLGKFPQALGQCAYWANRLRGRRSRIIEYKGAQGAAVQTQ